MSDVCSKGSGLFRGYLSEVFPSQINIDLTEFCNLACVHCPYETVTKIKGRNRRHLDHAHHTKLIDEIAETGRGHCRFIRYTGDGETLLHPDHGAFIAYAVRRTGMPVNVTTNGLLLTEQRTRVLLEAGVDVFDISLDAFKPETYRVVRVGGDLDTARENVLRLIRLAREMGGRSRVMVSFVTQPANADEADAFKAYWMDQGADHVVLRRQHSAAGSMPEMANTMWRAAPAQRSPCLYPWERLVVKPDGKITYCPADWLHNAAVGDIAHDTIAGVWQGATMRALREAHVSGDLSAHAFCHQCPDWSVIPWPEEQRSYATAMHKLAPSGSR